MYFITRKYKLPTNKYGDLLSDKRSPEIFVIDLILGLVRISGISTIQLRSGQFSPDFIVKIVLYFQLLENPFVATRPVLTSKPTSYICFSADCGAFKATQAELPRRSQVHMWSGTHIIQIILWIFIEYSYGFLSLFAEESFV